MDVDTLDGLLVRIRVREVEDKVIVLEVEACAFDIAKGSLRTDGF